MSKDQIKNEINKVLDQFPSNTLQEILHFLKKIENQHSWNINPNDLNKILTEDKDLLERLAK